MKRKTKKQLVQRIIQVLENKEMSVYEIADTIKSNWDTVLNALELLETLNLVKSKREGNKRIYTLTRKDRFVRRDDTLFGIPINQEAENLCKCLFIEIRSKWFNLKKEYPNRTQMQKVVAEVSERLNSSFVPIPKGWYIFGQICILKYDPEIEYKCDPVEIPNLNPIIHEAIELYCRYENTKQILFEQYKRKNNTLYLAKLKLQELLGYQYTPENITLLSKLLYVFGANFQKRGDNEEITELLNTYISILNKLFAQRNKEELESMRDTIRDSFTALWELMATYNLFNSLVEGKYGYSRDNLRKYFDERLEVLCGIASDYLSELYESSYKKETKSDSNLFLPSKDIKVNKISNEERKKIFEEFSKKDTSNIFRELDLN